MLGVLPFAILSNPLASPIAFLRLSRIPNPRHHTSDTLTFTTTPRNTLLLSSSALILPDTYNLLHCHLQ